jgi:hypothetical protein
MKCTEACSSDCVTLQQFRAKQGFAVTAVITNIRTEEIKIFLPIVKPRRCTRFSNYLFL